MGCPFTPKEREAYVALWRLLSHHLGVLPVNNPHTSFKAAASALER